MEAAPHPWPALGALLLRDGLVTRDDLEQVLSQQRDSLRQRISGKRLGEALVDRGLVTDEQVARLVAEQYELPFVELDEADVNLEVAALVPEEVARRLSALPVGALPDDSVLVAIADPTNVLHSDELRRVIGRPLRFAVSTPNALRAAIARADAHSRETTKVDPVVIDEVVLEALPNVENAHATERSRSIVDVVRADSPRSPLGALLVREGVISEQDLEAALAQQRLTGSKRLGEVLIERGAVTRSQVARMVAQQYELPFVELTDLDVDENAAALLDAETARRHCALPVGFSADGSLLVAVADPTNAFYADDLRLALEMPVEFAVADPDSLEAEIERIHPDTGAEPAVEPGSRTEHALSSGLHEPDGGTSLAQPDATDVERASAQSAEVVRTIERALALGATDIHFVPESEGVSVRVRLDGVLRVLDAYPTARAASIADSLNELGELVAAESGAYHEGRLTLSVDGREVNLRAVILPTASGEKATLHVLRDVARPGALADLGLSPHDEAALRAAISEPAGLVLLCGLPGHGCPTTMHALIRELRSVDRALATIEESVEQLVPGIDQVTVDTAAGGTYSAALRGVLLSDPDIVVVGELDESDTAQTAVSAALSGRLVVSRLRAGTPSDALERLSELGVEPASISATVSCVLGQRLVRRVCPDCRAPYYPSASELAELGRPPDEAGRRLLARGRGCIACEGTGFRGKVALFELLPMTSEIKELVGSGAAPGEIRQAAARSGMRTFRDEGIRVCLEGMTTVSEVVHVVPEDVTRTSSHRAPDSHEDGEIAPA